MSDLREGKGFGRRKSLHLWGCWECWQSDLQIPLRFSWIGSWPPWCLTRNVLSGRHGCVFCLSHTHGHKGAACLQHPLCILECELWVVERKWYRILFLLSFLPRQQETLGDCICSQYILQKWPKLLLIVVAGLNSCPQCVYNWRDKQFVLKIMTNHLYLVYKRTVCSLNTCTRSCVCEGKTKCLSEQCPAWSCPLWDHPALVKGKKKKQARFSFLPRTGDLGASPGQM